jgi:hypothetical protein
VHHRHGHRLTLPVSATEDRFFAEVAARDLVRPSVRAVIVRDGHLLGQRPVDAAPGSGFVHAGHRVHALEHYGLVSIDTADVASREEHLVQEWLPFDTVATADLRPHVVRDVLAEGRHDDVRHLVSDGWAPLPRTHPRHRA